MDLADTLPTMGVQSVAPLASCSEPLKVDTNSNSKASPSDTLRAQSVTNNVVGDPTIGLYILRVGEGTPTS